jgi:hypothetical protein
MDHSLVNLLLCSVLPDALFEPLDAGSLLWEGGEQMAEEMAAQTGMERVSPHNHYSHLQPKRVILRCIPLRIINVTAEGSQSSTQINEAQCA